MSYALARGIDQSREAAPVQSKWGWFLVLGMVLVVCGALAVALPAASTIGAGMVLGVVLSIAGIVKIIQSLQVKEWRGFLWHELTGAVELVGGVLIYFNPLKGALALSLLIALVFLVKLPHTRFYTPGTIAGIALLVAGCAYVAIAFAVKRSRP
jgi:uncharacterized membrane protein HdeD (DUF308 family)